MARYISIGIATKIRVEKIDSLMSISELMRSIVRVDIMI